MTFIELDKHVNNYLSYLKSTRAIKNIGDVYYKISYSKKSKSFYIKLCIVINDVAYRKTIRFSDHAFFPHTTYPQKIKGIVIEKKPEDLLSKKEIKHVEALLRKEIKKLQYTASITTVLKFKADSC
jgi:uncharacterized protein YlbG (UPF0298 family)